MIVSAVIAAVVGGVRQEIAEERSICIENALQDQNVVANHRKSLKTGGR